MSTHIKRLLITAGEPAGIGPELCLKIATHSWDAELIIIADPELLQQYALLLSLDIQILIWTPQTRRAVHKPNTLNVYPITMAESVVPGVLSTGNAKYVLETLSAATKLMLSQEADALVTAPVHKGIINQAGISFTGHTEFLAEKSAAKKVVMMLVCEQFRVALVTTHLPLRQVADAITHENLQSVIELLHQELRHRFDIPDPVIHVCGLNPHAGESGYLGREEIEIIEPVINKLRKAGYKIKGPLPADTALTPAGLKDADVTLAMYHDQGLPVLKYAAFGSAVNITLGLPFIRVSVDHGTAVDLAGSGKATTSSMRAAINQAIDLVNVHPTDHQAIISKSNADLKN